MLFHSSKGRLPGRPDARLAPIIWILPEGTVNRRQGLGSEWSPTRAAEILECRFLEIAARVHQVQRLIAANIQC